jgi:hypothetical protein
MSPTNSTIKEELTRALGEAVIRIWSNLPQDVQDHLFKEAVASQGETIRSQLAVMTSIRARRTRWPRRPSEMRTDRICPRSASLWREESLPALAFMFLDPPYAVSELKSVLGFQSCQAGR